MNQPLKKILKKENSRDSALGHFEDTQVAADPLRRAAANKKSDIFIVAHKGVIQMSACTLTGRPPEDRWPDLTNGEYIIIQK